MSAVTYEDPIMLNSTGQDIVTQLTRLANNQTYTAGDGIDISNQNVVSTKIASTSQLGAVKVDGTTITADANGVITANIANKADKVTSATADDFATLNASGNLVDSGINKNIVPSGATSSNKLATTNDIPTELNDLSDDVVITNPVNAQVLVYNSTSGKWENQTGQGTIGGAVFKGSINFTNLPTTGMENGDWYDIKDTFTTDNRFEEGSGIACAAGTDVIWVSDDNKWNILTPSGVYSFNGRTGAVVPTSGDYDASDVDYDNTTSGLTADDVQEAIDEVVSNIPTVSVSYTGTASSTGVRKQQITVNSVSYDVDGSAYMEQSVTLSTSATTPITFTNAIIADGKMLTFASSLWDLVPDSITTAVGSCTITLPKWSSAETIGCRLYVR